jgi:short-subunit dehydrogenase
VFSITLSLAGEIRWKLKNLPSTRVDICYKLAIAKASEILINVDSVVRAEPQPYTSGYLMTKFAIRGLLGCLRMELHLDNAPDIHICTVMPATIDTPLFNCSTTMLRIILVVQPRQ